MWITIGLGLICALLVFPGRKRGRSGADPLFRGTGRHWHRAYSRRAFLRLGGTVAVAGLLAYSGVDRAVDRWYADSARSRFSDGVASFFKPLGERFWFFNWLLIAGVDAWWRTSSFSRWGRENFEAMAVGLPTLWTLQRGLGSNRPSDEDGDPRWRPLHDDHAASGHTFMAAIPLLNLARATNQPLGRWLLRLGSLPTGWSRINDRRHYLSQVVLGWVTAYNAAAAVHDDPVPALASSEAVNPGGDSLADPEVL